MIISCASYEDSDQPVHSCSLIRVFAVRLKTLWILAFSQCHAQADLSLLLAYMQSCRKCCAPSHYCANYTNCECTNGCFYCFYPGVSTLARETGNRFEIDSRYRYLFHKIIYLPGVLDLRRIVLMGRCH